MTIIKGPVRITGGFNVRDFLKEKVGKVKMKLPFEATGWKSTRNADLVTTGKKETPLKKEEKVKKKTMKMKRRGK